MPTKPEKHITISNKFKVYFYPIVFTVIIVLLFIASIISLPNDLGSIIVGLYILLFVLTLQSSWSKNVNKTSGICQRTGNRIEC